MAYLVVPSKRFTRQYKKLLKSDPELSGELKIVIDLLARPTSLPSKNRNHRLVGNFSNYWECHISYDWLLIYQYHHDVLVLELIATGSHNDLF